jgi:hypothetical protein
LPVNILEPNIYGNQTPYIFDSKIFTQNMGGGIYGTDPSTQQFNAPVQPASSFRDFRKIVGGLISTEKTWYVYDNAYYLG